MNIKIRFNQDRKLFKANAEYEFDGKLIIISGVNGCGKSQLLNAISAVETNYLFEQTDGSSPKKLNSINVCHTTIDGIQLNRSEVLSRSYRDNISVSDISAINVNLMASSKQTAYNIYKQICGNVAHYTNQIKQGTFQLECSRAFNSMWTYIINSTTKENLYKLTESEFINKLPDNFIWRKDDSFTDFIGSWFNLFACERHDEKAKCGESGVKFDSDNFNKKAPWILLNSLFEKLKFFYRFKNEYDYKTPSLIETPQIYSVLEDGQIDLNSERKLSELSDGEKAIIILAVISLDNRCKTGIKLLVLDEFDATLNPSLTKAFFTVLNDYFIKSGVSVILSTHSPATIALAPDNAMFYEILPKFNSESPKIVQIERVEYKELEVIKAFYENLLTPNQKQILRESKNIINSQRPSCIFICEDSDKKTMELWGSLFQKAEISDVTVISSGGCCNEDLEKHINSIQNYTPRVIRQFDRDGMTNEQVRVFTANFESNFYNDKECCVKVLPVNEIENFVVIHDTETFNDDFWATHRDNVENAFELTSNSRFNQLRSKFGEIFSKLHSDSGNDMKTTQVMRDTARANWCQLMPGKDICKKVPNYTPIQKIQNLDYPALPQLLRDFLYEIKQFYFQTYDSTII